MENKDRTPADLVASLCLDPGFVLVPQDRYEELVRAETERDVMGAVLDGDSSYKIDTVYAAIKSARNALYRMKMLEIKAGLPTPESEANAE